MQIAGNRPHVNPTLDFALPHFLPRPWLEFCDRNMYCDAAATSISGQDFGLRSCEFLLLERRCLSCCAVHVWESERVIKQKERAARSEADGKRLDSMALVGVEFWGYFPASYRQFPPSHGRTARASYDPTVGLAN